MSCTNIGSHNTIDSHNTNTINSHNIIDSHNTKDSHNTTLNVHLRVKSTVNIQLRDGITRTEILAWLSPLEPRIQHEKFRSHRVPGVGDWFLRTELFQSWSDVSRGDESNNATLFCYGDPGVGKTYITSLVIDTLGDQLRNKNVIVTGFYFDFAARKEQFPTDMLGALLRQVVNGLKEIPEEIDSIYRRQRVIVGGRAPQLPDIITMLRTASASQRIFMCIDALDECVAEHRQEVLESLLEILKNSPGIRLFLTGIQNIRSEIERIFPETATFINIRPNKGDIVTYIVEKIKRDTKIKAMNDGLKTDILTKIPAMDSGISRLLVSLIMEAILSERMVYTRRHRLETAVSGSGDFYDRILSRVRAQDEIDEEIGMAALMWVSYSERPLKADELCHALAVEIQSADLDLERVPSVEMLSDCCQGLLAVDHEVSTVRLIHSTLQEHLSTHPDLFNRPHSTIAETCLAYLNFRRFKGPPAGKPLNPVQAPFLGYSSVYWGTHAKRELSDRAKLLALKLFRSYDSHISAKLLLKDALGLDDFSGIEDFSSFTGLHCASFFGVVEVVAALVGINCCNINQRDCVGNTPLMWAIRNGHEGVVELLQKREDVTSNTPCGSSLTPPLQTTSRKRKRVEIQSLGPDAPKSPQRPRVEEQEERRRMGE